MNIDDVRRYVKEIEEAKDDDEMAHCSEDNLYSLFVEHVSKRDDELGNMAKEILKTKSIAFFRWCA